VHHPLGVTVLAVGAVVVRAGGWTVTVGGVTVTVDGGVGAGAGAATVVVTFFVLVVRCTSTLTGGVVFAVAPSLPRWITSAVRNPSRSTTQTPATIAPVFEPPPLGGAGGCWP